MPRLRSIPRQPKRSSHGNDNDILKKIAEEARKMCKNFGLPYRSLQEVYESLVVLRRTQEKKAQEDLN
jgi:hypothetical protein